jgi:polysaccharide export outer membrane protein
MNLPFVRPACRLFGLGALFAGLTVMIYAQASAPPAGPPDRAVAYTLTTGDRLNIAVVREDDLGVISPVNAKGTVNLKLVGEVHVAGLTIKEAQKAIEDAYKDGRYLRNPQVIINVETYMPRTVFISGEVKSAGVYNLPTETAMTIDELVLKAGGFTDTAKGTAVMVTRKLSDGKTTVIGPIDVEGIIKGRKSGVTVLELQPGDSVSVPQKIF